MQGRRAAYLGRDYKYVLGNLQLNSVHLRLCIYGVCATTQLPYSMPGSFEYVTGGSDIFDTVLYNEGM